MRVHPHKRMKSGSQQAQSAVHRRTEADSPATDNAVRQHTAGLQVCIAARRHEAGPVDHRSQHWPTARFVDAQLPLLLLQTLQLGSAAALQPHDRAGRHGVRVHLYPANVLSTHGHQAVRLCDGCASACRLGCMPACHQLSSPRVCGGSPACACAFAGGVQSTSRANRGKNHLHRCCHVVCGVVPVPPSSVPRRFCLPVCLEVLSLAPPRSFCRGAVLAGSPSFFSPSLRRGHPAGPQD